MKLIEEKLSSWVDDLASLLPNIVLAILVVIIAFFISKSVRKYTKNIGSKISSNKAVVNLISTVAYIMIILIGLLIALNIVNLGKAATSMLAGAGIIGIALGFAFQDIAANFISGVMLSIQRPFKIGDIIKSKDIFGKVIEISIRSTEIDNLQGIRIEIPNKEILLNPLRNYSKTMGRRVDLKLGVAYNSDLEKVEKLTTETIESMSEIDNDKKVTFNYTEFADSSINLNVSFWVDKNEELDFLDVKSRVIKEIKSAFDKNNIEIPFPIRTLVNKK